MKRRASTMIGLINTQVQHLVEVVQRDGLVALRRNVQAVEPMLVLDHVVATLINKHLADFYVSIKRRVMDGGEFLIQSLPIDPSLNNIDIVTIFLMAQCTILRNLKQFTKNY